MTFYKSIIIRWATLGVFFAALLFASVPAKAVESGGIGGRPENPRAENPRSQSIFVYELKPGQEITDSVRIYNNTEQQKTIRVYPVDSIISSGGAFACAQAADPVKDVGGWITVEKESVTLAAQSNDVVGFKLKIPENIEPGEHNGCIAIQEDKPSATSAENGIALSFRSAIRVAITVPGEITKELAFRSLVANLRNDKIITTALLKNNGNVSLDTTIKTTLNNIIGGDVEAIEGTYVLLPKTLTELNFEFKKPFWGGWYKFNSVAKYNANTDQSLGEGNNTKEVTISSGYLFVPPKPAALVVEIAALLAIIILARFAYNRYWVLPRMKKDFVEYTIKEGDEIKALANKHKISWKHLAHINKIKAPYTLVVGTILLVPKKHHSNTKEKSKTKKSSKEKPKKEQ